jgi:hypothetical protein
MDRCQARRDFTKTCIGTTDGHLEAVAADRFERREKLQNDVDFSQARSSSQ